MHASCLLVLSIGHGALGIGHWALGIGHGAWGIGHWALGMGHWVWFFLNTLMSVKWLSQVESNSLGDF
jgi:hypothetical protein